MIVLHILFQIPPMANYSMDGRTYRYFKGEPLYPFGYGLSYTTFEYSDLLVTPDTVTSKSETNIQITVNVKNTGNFDADEVRIYNQVISNYYQSITKYNYMYEIIIVQNAFLFLYRLSNVTQGG